MRYWINTVSRNHVQRGVAGGFTQANHGKNTALRRLQSGDMIVFYSPRTDYPDGAPLQHFTALGRVADDALYQSEMSPSFHPWRRNIEYLACDEAPIQPLIADLDFIQDKKSWGFPFRRGLFEINEADFRRIAAAMGVETVLSDGNV
ncbi:MAG: EVE domain-containing protein [Anaerolineae bacterium]